MTRLNAPCMMAMMLFFSLLYSLCFTEKGPILIEARLFTLSLSLFPGEGGMAREKKSGKQRTEEKAMNQRENKEEEKERDLSELKFYCRGVSE